MATMDMASNMAKKTGNALVVGTNKTYSNGGSRKDKHSNSVPSAEDRVSVMQFICHVCHRSRQGKKLL